MKDEGLRVLLGHDTQYRNKKVSTEFFVTSRNVDGLNLLELVRMSNYGMKTVIMFDSLFDIMLVHAPNSLLV